MLALLVLVSTATPAAGAAAAAEREPGHAAGRALRDVVFVANAEGGTVSVVDAGTFDVIREINVLPDGANAEAEEDPLQALLGQRLVEAAGGKNYAQDQDLSPDGRVLYVSRGHRGDVAAFDVHSGRLLWKVPVDGLRADHMTLSGDGRRLYVSDLTSKRVELIDTRRAAIIGSFPTGDFPHDNHFSADGRRLYNASLGNILAPMEVRAVKDDSYQLTVVDPESLEVQRTYEFERGIRPFQLTADETRMYAQLSELHGLIEFDLRSGTVLRRLELPIDAGVTEDDYSFEAPHHGLALSPDERTLCAAGRASDYVALVSTETLTADAIVDVGDAPSWATNGPDGRLCFVPNTRADTLSVVSYDQRREVARIPVGDGPKHIEAGRIPASAADARGRIRLDAEPGAVTAGRRVRFRFRAVTRDGGNPIGRATIRFAGKRVRTNRRGRARMTARLRRPGRHTARATARGLRPGSDVVRARRSRAGGPRFAG